MMRTPCFTDASSAILLEKATLFEPLSKVFKLVLARSVFHEITTPGYPGEIAFTAAFHQGNFRVQSPAMAFDDGPETCQMDKGERDTICLFMAQKQGFILTDDGEAARWCAKKNLPFINALLVPKLFWYGGLMTKNQCLNKMKALCRIGRYAENIRNFAFTCTFKDLSHFIPEQKNAR